jgi:anti-sigma factor RsiW
MHDDLTEMLRRHRDELRYRLPEPLRLRLTRPYRRERWMLRAPALAACACAALALAFAIGRTSSEARRGDALAQEVVASHVRSLMAGHLQDVGSTDKHTVKPWFEGRLDFGPDVRDFAEEGFPLAGGRLDYIDSRGVAALVYRRGSHVINVLEWPVSDTAPAAPRLLTLRGYQLFAWQKDGFAYWAVSDLNGADLQKFVDLWQR